ncbi:thyroid adenoma-associated protein homolog [Acanthaster planci]|uniref:tRNA (32-2'-O)-methyltransferase regulator THADA n=1 Tax=Acanthaster planci TaxID=133434 RepID=A0A8B7ZT18_ACAPL|nr:thyroid adenoma-associated protein homolog [Acanthaster planci]
MEEVFERKIKCFLSSGETSCLPWDYLNECLHGCHDPQQVTSLKKFGAVLKKQAHESISATEMDLCSDVLTQLFVAVDPKAALHRGIASILQGFPDKDHELVCRKLSTVVSNQLLLCSKMDARECRKCVDVVCGLLENFLLGEKSLSLMFHQVVTFLGEVLQIFMRSAKCVKDTIGQNEAMCNCMAAVKAVISVIQRCYQQESQLDDARNTSGTMETMLQMMWDILSDDSYLADCRSAAGMALVLLQRSLVSGDEHQLCNVIYTALFGHLSTSTCLLPLPSVQYQPPRFDTASLPAQSYLFVCHGVLAMLDSKDLMDQGLPVDGHCLLFDVLFPEILGLTERLTEPSSALAAARTLTLWTSTAVVAMTSGSHDNSEACLFGSAAIPQKLIHYVWTNWDHPIDGIRYQTKSIFENVLQLHVIAQQKSDYKPTEDQFLLDLLDSLMAVNWHVRGKYMPLGCLVIHVGAEKILASYPTMPQELLLVFGDQTLAPYACDLLERLFTHHKAWLAQCRPGADGIGRWQKMWIVPVLGCLCNPATTKDQKTYLIEYCVPRLLKCSPEALGFIVTHLHQANGSSSSSMDKSGLLGALVTCLKTARSMGLIEHAGKTDDNYGIHSSQACLWRGLVPYRKLREALCHRESQVRIDGLGLLCDCNKTTEAVLPEELALLRFFLVLNINSPSPSFRQMMGAHLKKLFVRIRESGRVCLKQMARQQKHGQPDSLPCSSSEGQIQTYKDFLSWLTCFLFEALKPGSSYPRRAVALHTLKTMAPIYGYKPKGSISTLFDLNEIWTPGNIQLLLHRLTDPYESNKVMAFDLLRGLSQETLGLRDGSCLHQIYLEALQLASSNKPHNCETASFVLRFVALQPTSLLERGVTDIPKSILGILTDLCKNLTEEVGVAKDSLLEAAVQGPMYGILHCIRELLGDVNLRTMSHSDGWNVMVSQLIQLCLEVAEVACVVVCNSSPEGYVPEESDSAFDQPEPASEEGCPPSNSPPAVLASKALKRVTPQMVLVCCWRSMKEVSLLMGHLALSAPLAGDGTCPGLISHCQLEDIGHFFLRLLKESKHRGAFELAYAGFIMLTTRLWKNESVTLHQLPKQWLEGLLSDITASQSMLCATRRSAGIPFAIQALVGSEPSSQGKSCFKQAMDTLLSLAFPKSAGSDSITSQIHALNILRVLFKDARLGEDVIPYIADGVRAAILGFAAQLWAVRNSSTLLFSALVTRIFGVQRAKQAHDRRNCMTGKEFFARFPSLHPFLLQQLKEATSVHMRSGTARLHPSLFPVLLLLSRLYPSPMDGARTRLSMDHFVPHVLSCASSAVYKTRAIAARALVPLVPASRQLDMLKDLLGLLPRTPDQPAHHNHIHGVLLQIREILDCAIQMASSQQTCAALVGVMSSVADCVWLASDDNGCCVTRASFLDILQTFLFNTSLLSTAFNLREEPLEDLKMVVTSIASRYIQNHSALTELSLHQPGFITLQTTCASICLRQRSHQEPQEIAPSAEPMDAIMKPVGSRIAERKFQDLPTESKVGFKAAHRCDEYRLEQSPEAILVSLLCSPYYEVRELALNHLIESCQNGPSENVSNSPEAVITSSSQLFEKLVTMVTEEEHEVCLSRVYELLSYHPMTCQFPWQLPKCQMGCIECFQIAMGVACLPRQKEDLISSVIQFTTCLVPVVHSELLSTKIGTGESVYKLLHDWALLLDQCSQAGQTVQSRLTVVKAIGSLATITLLDLSECLGNIPFVLWGAMMRFLQDDELEVQQGAVSYIVKLAIHVNLFSDLHDMDTQPSLGLHLGIQLFMSVFTERHPADCLCSLLQWGMGRPEETASNHEEEPQDERLFDQGEANTTFEGVHLAQIISNQLHAVALCCSGYTSDPCIIAKPTGKDSCTEDPETGNNPSVQRQSALYETVPTQTAVCDESKAIACAGDVSELPPSQDGNQPEDEIGVPSSDSKDSEPSAPDNHHQTGDDFLFPPFSLRLSASAIHHLQQAARVGLLDLATRLDERLQVWLPASPFLTAREWEMQCVECYKILLCSLALTVLLSDGVETKLKKRWGQLLENVGTRFQACGFSSHCPLVTEPLESLKLWCISSEDN